MGLLADPTCIYVRACVRVCSILHIISFKKLLVGGALVYFILYKEVEMGFLLMILEI